MAILTETNESSPVRSESATHEKMPWKIHRFIVRMRCESNGIEIPVFVVRTDHNETQKSSTAGTNRIDDETILESQDFGALDAVDEDTPLGGVAVSLSLPPGETTSISSGSSRYDRANGWGSASASLLYLFQSALVLGSPRL
mmetsp:Transcript_27162/g.63577  ORF Transcript_27162/g.63577 Transcript_27162/m.63577 type:complete len:142 (-) Transcript_27162:58-483(-)